MLHIGISDRLKAVIFIVLLFIAFGIVGRMDCEDYKLTHPAAPSLEVSL